MALFRGIRMEYEKAIRMGHVNGIRVKGESTTTGTPVENGDVLKGDGTVSIREVKGS